MKKIIFALVSVVLAAGAASALEVVRLPPGAGEGSSYTYAYFSAEISPQNIDSSEYYYNVTNPYNFTVQAEAYLSFGPNLTFLEITEGGKKIQPEATTKDPRYTQYRIQSEIAPNQTRQYAIAYSRVLVPGDGNLGMWGTSYSYTSPISFQIAPKDAMAGSPYYGTFTRYYGKIKIGYPAKDVFCSDCAYDAPSRTATVDGGQYFSLNWKESRTPVRAGIAYLALILGMLAYAMKKRQSKQ